MGGDGWLNRSSRTISSGAVMVAGPGQRGKEGNDEPAGNPRRRAGGTYRRKVQHPRLRPASKRSQSFRRRVGSNFANGESLRWRARSEVEWHSPLVAVPTIESVNQGPAAAGPFLNDENLLY